MKRVFKMEDLDCAHCAAKMEQGIQKINGVTHAQIDFFALTMTLEAPDEVFDKVLKKALSICHRVEPDCRIIVD